MTVGTLPDRRLAFFAGPKKVSKERTTLAAGISVAVTRCFDEDVDELITEYRCRTGSRLFLNAGDLQMLG